MCRSGSEQPRAFGWAALSQSRGMVRESAWASGRSQWAVWCDHRVLQRFLMLMWALPLPLVSVVKSRPREGL